MRWRATSQAHIAVKTLRQDFSTFPGALAAEPVSEESGTRRPRCHRPISCRPCPLRVAAIRSVLGRPRHVSTSPHGILKTLYMEEGGDGASAKAALRQGMDTLLEPLKQVARAKSWRWRLVCCGSRNEAHRGFRNALDRGDGGVCILLVDAEGPVNQSAGHHLRNRDGWDSRVTPKDQIHLMVQAMEAWTCPSKIWSATCAKRHRAPARAGTTKSSTRAIY